MLEKSKNLDTSPEKKHARIPSLQIGIDEDIDEPFTFDADSTPEARFHRTNTHAQLNEAMREGDINTHSKSKVLGATKQTKGETGGALSAR